MTDAGIDETNTPKISIGGAVSDALMTMVGGDNKRWEYTWSVLGTDPDGPVSVSIDAYDVPGNPNTAATGDINYTIDNTPPAKPSTPTAVEAEDDGYIDEQEESAGFDVVVTFSFDPTLDPSLDKLQLLLN